MCPGIYAKVGKNLSKKKQEPDERIIFDFNFLTVFNSTLAL